MPRSKTASFITELPIIVCSKSDSELRSRFQAGRHFYNACLGEAMTRVELIKNSEVYKKAISLPRTIKKNQEYISNPELKKLFSQAWKQYRFSEYELHSYGTSIANQSKWIAQKVDSNTQQKLATRAFNAAKKVLLGQSKKVRYKVSSRFRSMEGKTNSSGIRWKNERLVWGKLKLNAIIDWTNPVIKHGRNSKVKYVRIIWRELNGKRRWYIQLINEGLPYQKPQNYVIDGVIGLDLNISNIAFVGDKKAGLLPFAQNVPIYQQEIRRLERKMERSRRANNPDNYEPDTIVQQGSKIILKQGKAIKGKKQWNNSQIYLKTRTKKREFYRRKTAYAQCQNRKIVNEILRHGKYVKTENVSVKGWQKRYGKAIGAKSPGFVQSELKRKAESASGSFQTFSTRKTALSQTHLSGKRIKKPLSQRVHRDVTGKIIMHRDLFSAYLARFVNQDETLLLHLAVNQWERSEPILEEAWQQYQKLARVVGESETLRSDSSVEQVSLKLGSISQISHEGLKANVDSSARIPRIQFGGVAQNRSLVKEWVF